MLKNIVECFGVVVKCFYWIMVVVFILVYIVVYYVIWFIDFEISIKFVLFGIELNGELVIFILNIYWVLGVSIGVLVILCLIWCWINVELLLVLGSVLEYLLVKLVYWVLYLFMIVMLFMGYLNIYDLINFGFFIILVFCEMVLFYWIVMIWQFMVEQVEIFIFVIYKFLGDWVVWVVVFLYIVVVLFYYCVCKDVMLVCMLLVLWGGKDEGEWC